MTNKKQIISLVLGLLLISPMANAFVTWTSHADGETHQYAVVYDWDVTWDEANTNAADYGVGWHLATITSAAEQAYLEDALLTSITDGNKFWLGAYQDADAVDAMSGWHWITGEAWDFTNWGDGVNLGADTDGQEHLFTTNYLAWDWDDALISRQLTGYILERSGESVNAPEPGTLALFGVGLAGLGFVHRRKVK